ncbi:hypothetical protein [Mucisphaera sp.]|uniref:hypothetical protein n=1 Tax=Mucisphaera sp. TaxID=2913024 RepID=UPI003D0BEA27
MSKASAAVAEIQRMIKTLEAERGKHVAAIEEIDATFASLGLGAPSAPKKRGRPAKKAGAKRGRPAGRRKRGSFKVTGEESILLFVQKSSSPPNAADINKHWQKEGRGGKADNTISRLVKEKRLERVKKDGERGARYKFKK